MNFLKKKIELCPFLSPYFYMKHGEYHPRRLLFLFYLSQIATYSGWLCSSVVETLENLLTAPESILPSVIFCWYSVRTQSGRQTVFSPPTTLLKMLLSKQLLTFRKSLGTQGRSEFSEKIKDDYGMQKEAASLTN